MQLPVSAYFADRGYAWSNVPEGFSTERLNSICRAISAFRGDFPDPLTVEVGVVSDGDTAAAFTLQNVEHWDAEKRSSDYIAAALFPMASADQIDFVGLLSNDFFWTPSHHPPTFIEYEGAASHAIPEGVLAQLKTDKSVSIDNPRALGSILAAVRDLGNHWVCRLFDGNVMEIKCN